MKRITARRDEREVDILPGRNQETRARVTVGGILTSLVSWELWSIPKLNAGTMFGNPVTALAKRNKIVWPSMESSVTALVGEDSMGRRVHL